MIFDDNNPIIKIENAEHLKWGCGTFDVRPRDYSALAFRVEGSADLICEGLRFHVSPGQILYMPQGLGYQVEYSPTDMYVMHFSTTYNDPLPEIYHPANTQEVRILFEKAATLWKHKDPGYVNFCTSILYRILGILCSNNLMEQYPAGLQLALQYIHQNYRQKLSTEDICKHAGISPTSFRQYFQKYCHTTSTDYIRNLRLEYARRIIASGVSIEQAAQMCGIGDSKYFARLVNKEFGCSPRQFKNYGK